MRLWAGRLYKSGTTWCVWRWTDVQSEYIVRLHVLKTNFKHGLGAICLHWIKKPDPEPYDHDHPVTFLSIILRGWYIERRVIDGCVETVRCHNWFNFIRASENDCHTIIACAPNTLTLCIMGPKRREWGFYDPWRDRWLMWKDYYAMKRAGQITAERPQRED